MLVIVYILAAVTAAALIAVAVLYNALVQRRQMTNNGWADIDVQLKRRADLIPRLVGVVEGYAAHERQLFAEVAEKRSAALAAGDDPARRSAAESALSKPVARLVAVAESYPELKASQNFLELQKELSDTEGKVEMARRFYNGAVRELNIAVETFPSNIVAAGFSIAKRSYFETDTADRAVPTIGLAKS
jgi:LemA protein